MRYSRDFRARQPGWRRTLLQQAIAAIRRNGAALFHVPLNFSGSWTDSSGVDPVNELSDVIGLMTDRSYGVNNLGPELVTNSGFDNGLTGWTQLIGTASVVSGAARVVTPNSTQVGRLVSTVLPCTVGRTYRCTVRCVQGTASGADVTVSVSPTTVAGAIAVRQNTGTVDLSFVFTATQTNHWIFLDSRLGATATYSDFDNVSVRDVLGAVATQATTANKPTVQRPAANNVIRFDALNDSLSVNMASGGSPFVRSYTRTGTVSGFTSATTTGFVLGQPTVAGRDVCAIVCAPSAIAGADLTAIERWAASIGANL